MYSTLGQRLLAVMKAMSIALEVWKIGRERSNGSGGGSGRAVEWVECGGCVDSDEGNAHCK